MRRRRAAAAATNRPAGRRGRTALRAGLPPGRVANASSGFAFAGCGATKQCTKVSGGALRALTQLSAFDPLRTLEPLRGQPHKDHQNHCVLSHEERPEFLRVLVSLDAEETPAQPAVLEIRSDHPDPPDASKPPPQPETEKLVHIERLTARHISVNVRFPTKADIRPSAAGLRRCARDDKAGG
jgi:hypothetical protein